jgi:hypothetical protein
MDSGDISLHLSDPGVVVELVGGELETQVEMLRLGLPEGFD